MLNDFDNIKAGLAYCSDKDDVITSDVYYDYIDTFEMLKRNFDNSKPDNVVFFDIMHTSLEKGTVAYDNEILPYHTHNTFLSYNTTKEYFILDMCHLMIRTIINYAKTHSMVYDEYLPLDTPYTVIVNVSADIEKLEKAYPYSQFIRTEEYIDDKECICINNNILYLPRKFELTKCGDGTYHLLHYYGIATSVKNNSHPEMPFMKYRLDEQYFHKGHI